MIFRFKAHRRLFGPALMPRQLQPMRYQTFGSVPRNPWPLRLKCVEVHLYLFKPIQAQHSFV